MKFSKKEALKFGWEEFKIHWKLLLAVWLIVVAVNLFLSWWQENINSDLWVVGVTIGLISGVFSLVTTLGTTKIALLIADGEKAAPGDLFGSWRLVLKYLLVQILVGLITAVGFLLLIVPGLIFAARLQFVAYVLVDKNMGVLEAIRESWRMTNGSVVNLMLWGFVSTLVTLLGILALGVGVFVAVPVIMLGTAYIYRKLV